jgi:hypothetical protein
MTQPPVTPNYTTQRPQPGSGLAVASLILGILSIVSFCFWFLAIPLGVVAAILGWVARGQVRRGEASGDGMAKAGLILGIIGAALSLILTIAAFAGLHVFGNKFQQQMQQIQQQQQQRLNSQPTTSPE